MKRTVKPTAAYVAAVGEFLENEACSPVEEVPLNPRCIQIARRFHKTPAEVALDINREYIRSFRPMPGNEFHLLPATWPKRRTW
jgi:hypothetical protein